MLNDKQKSYRNILIGFILGSSLFEISYYLINGRVHLESTPFITIGALITCIIGMVVTRTN
jgi:hypothetical protein